MLLHYYRPWSLGASRLIVVTFALGIVSTGVEAQDKSSPKVGIYVVDSGGRLSESHEIGANLHTGARGLEPRRMYEFEVTLAGKGVSYARLMSDARGNINPFVLWYQSGVVGCSVESLKTGQYYPIAFRDFDEAERS